MQRTETLAIALLILGIVGAFGLGSVGCGDNDGEVKACDSCPGQFAYFCQVPSSNNIICAVDDAQATLLCPEGWSGKVNCAEGTGGQQAWDPGSMIQYDRTSEAYRVERELLDVLALDGAVLIAQDSARLTALAGGYFQFDGIAPDDLAAHLGFEDGDVPLSANGLRLETWDDYATAITQLSAASGFVVIVERDEQEITLQYEVL